MPNQNKVFLSYLTYVYQVIFNSNQHFYHVYKTVEHQQRIHNGCITLTTQTSLSGQNCKTFCFAPKDVLRVDTFSKTMLCVSPGICTFYNKQPFFTI